MVSSADDDRGDLNRAIGELIGEVRGINRRLDEFLKDHATIEKRVGTLENRLSWAQGAAWAAAGLASTLGLDRLFGFFAGKH